MSDELKEKIGNMVSYYRHHSMIEMVKGESERLQNFVLDDFAELLTNLEKEIG